MKQRILIVENEDILRESIKNAFLNSGYEVLEAKNGKEVLSLVEENEIHLVILATMLPEIDGWSVYQRVRKISLIPIIMLTLHINEDDILLGEELGAEDYVTKSYSAQILLAKTKQLLDNQVVKKGISEELLLTSGTDVHFPLCIETIEEKDNNLTHIEFQILNYLMENQDSFITREQLILKIWGHKFVVDDHTVNSHIRNLRNKLVGRFRREVF
ncbi:response regulator transcription factor [Bacillus cereus]|uniref:response regulator transcription factor n=1 Tax=Bacillus cereus TaxID=1396 RepID=UPI000BFA88D0|nr:response regulator transcription factor [Bacillus cereus]PER90910.1 DNA-binding response regulator [Bacillus cereus]